MIRSAVIRTAGYEPTIANDDEVDEKKEKAPGMDVITGRTGGAYIPPARLKMMQASIKDKNSMEYQRISWEALKKSINGLINKVNVSNITIIVRELFKENLIRGKGLFCRSLLQAQAASPTFSHVYAAVVAVINSKFPNIGELVLKRLIIQFRRGYKRNDKHVCMTSTRFLAHLVNQQVAHEVAALELLTLLLENTTNDSVEVAVGFLKECGMKLTELSPRGIHAIFERLRSILHEANVDKRVQYMIEVMFAVRKDGFKDHQAIAEGLDLVEESEQFTHLITLDDPKDGEDRLNVFRFDVEFEMSEEKYKAIKKEILDEGSSDEDGSGSDGEGSAEDEEDEEVKDSGLIIDNTETNLVALRRTIYLTIQSSLDYEECAHKLLKLELKGGQIVELCHMIVDCCAQNRTYMKFFGLLAQRFCEVNQEYIEPFSDIFKMSYDTIHRFETNKLRNVGKLFAHLLFTDAMGWEVLGHIKLNEDDTTSSSRVFIKILFQELVEYMGLVKLNARIKDPTLQEAFDGLFPKDNPRNTRFSINFFTSIGLGGLTDDLREFLTTQPKPVLNPAANVLALKEESSSSSSSSSSSDSSSDSDSSSSDSDSSSSSDASSKKKRSRKDSSKRHHHRKSPDARDHSDRKKSSSRRLDESSRKSSRKERVRSREPLVDPRLVSQASRQDEKRRSKSRTSDIAKSPVLKSSVDESNERSSSRRRSRSPRPRKYREEGERPKRRRSTSRDASPKRKRSEERRHHRKESSRRSEERSSREDRHRDRHHRR
ncbi:Pre-mRNA-splicing factor CWC22 -like protein [Halotydeus destructor]|nr:Pre-mRNA-splicing factor CWC22 -like protein [Halotydeus destructor]